MEVRLVLPKIPSGLFGNLLGLFALAGFAVCVGGLLDAVGMPGAWWASGIIGMVELFALSWVASAHSEAQSEAAVKAMKAPTQQLRPVTAAVRSA